MDDTSESFKKFRDIINEAIKKFFSLYENDPEFYNEERITQFIDTAFFDNEPEQKLIQSFLDKSLDYDMIVDSFLEEKFFPIWQKFFNASSSKVNTSKIGLKIGDGPDQIKKTHLNLHIVFDTNKQKEILKEHLSVINPNIEENFFAIKFFCSNPKDVESFFNEMLPIADGFIQNLRMMVKPQISIISGDDHLIIQANFKKSFELNWWTILIGDLFSEFKHNLELKLNLEFGTNFKYLIENHTDNTLIDLLNGSKIDLELKNNLGGFLDEVVKEYKEKEEFKKMYKACKISLVLGSLSLTSQIKMNLGSNEISLMSQLPTINIFNKEGILSKTPISTAKAIRDENEMVGPILNILNTLEGRGEIYISSPIFTAYADVDITGILDLVNSTIDLFGK